LALGFLAALAGASAVAQAETYIISKAEGVLPFERGIAEIEIAGGTVSGQFTPLHFYAENHFQVSGRNDRDGELDITIGMDPPLDVTLRKKITGNGAITWEGGGLRLFRIHNREFSEAALALTPRECGGINGSLQLEISRRAQEREIREFFAGPGKDLNVKVSWSRCDATWLVDEVVCTMEAQNQRWAEEGSESSAYYTGVVFDVPVGSELAVLERVRPLRWVHALDLNPGGCGGGFVSNVNLATSKVFGGPVYSKPAAARFIERNIRQLFASSFARVEKIEVRPLPKSRFGFELFATIAADAATTRRAEGWDLFTLQVVPTDNLFASSTEFSLDVYTNGLATAQKNAGETTPPTDTSRYKIYDEEGFAGALAASKVSDFVLSGIASANGGWCILAGEDIEDGNCTSNANVDMMFDAGN
jgi:hypothetical protein